MGVDTFGEYARVGCESPCDLAKFIEIDEQLKGELERLKLKNYFLHFSHVLQVILTFIIFIELAL